MLNVSPIGRNCSQEERKEFEKYDKVSFRSFQKKGLNRYFVCGNKFILFK